MTIEKLNELIFIINEINSTEQYTPITKCLEMLELRNTGVEKITLDKFGKHREKDDYIEYIIKETEKRLDKDQLEYFYSSLKPYYLSFVSDIGVKINSYNNLKENNEILDYNGRFNSSSFIILKRIGDSNYLKNILDEYREKMDEDYIVEILCCIKDNEYKIKYIDKSLDDPEYLIQLIYSFDSDKLIDKYLTDYSDELDGYVKEYEYISSLNEDIKKIEYLKNNPTANRKTIQVLKSIKNEKSLEEIYEYLDCELKCNIIYKFEEENKKIEYLTKLNSEIDPNDKENKDILTLIVDELSDENILYVINNLKNIKCSGDKLFEYRDEKMILEILKAYPSKLALKRARIENLISSDNIIGNIDLFLEYEKLDNKDKIKEYLVSMYQSNNDILSNKSWNILDEKYVNIFGLEKLNVIASYADISNYILKMNDKQLIMLNKCLNEYLKKYNTDEWHTICERMIMTIKYQNVDKNDKFSFIENFDDINIDRLLFILINGDEVGVKSVEDINNYYELLAQKCDEQIKSNDINLKKDAIMMKSFGISDKFCLLDGFRGMIKDGMLRLYHKYDDAINIVEDENIKKIFKYVKEISECDDPIKLEKIYNNIKSSYHLDTFRLESLLRKDYMKLYNRELLQVSNLEPLEDNMYDAGVNFCIISTSVGAYVKNNPEDYKKDWNRPSLGSPHFCTNFIRNDMMGTAPVPHLMYGFSNMSDDSLVLAGPTDLSSSGQSLASTANHGEKYYNPDGMINETHTTHYKFNEMDFKRVQNGKKKVPDYILVKKINGIIENLDEAKKASAQWDNLPIVVIDVDKCLENEYKLLMEMIDIYSNTPTTELLERIIIKINNNRVTNDRFASNIDIEMLRSKLNESNMEINSETEDIKPFMK